MTACRCEQCSDDPDYTYTDDWRHECEARMVALMDAERRTAYLEGVKEKRGADAHQRIAESLHEADYLAACKRAIEDVTL